MLKLRPVSRPKDFIYEHQQMRPFRKREVVIRFSVILLFGFLSPLFLYDFPVVSNEFFRLFLVSVIRTALLWHGSMIIIYYWTARYSIFSQPARLLIYQLTTLAVFVVLVSVGEIWSMKWAVGYPMEKKTAMDLLLMTLLITFLISSIYASIGFFMQWKQNLVKAQSLEKANLEAQYESLKTQVNPHFLFNSLNTLLSIVQGHAEAEKYIENLSEFMRYILKNRERNSVTLREELEVAGQYAYLQKSRFQNKLQIAMDVPEKYHLSPIPPLALQMLIENAIKHNEISTEHPLGIRLYVMDNEYLVVENAMRKKLDPEHSTGLGLKNIRDRYQFLLGKDILVKEEDGKFIVCLPIEM